MLSSLQAGIIVKHLSVRVPRTKLNLEVLNILYREGFIDGFNISVDDPKIISVFLKYGGDNKPILKQLRIISTPGRRIYVSYEKIVKELSKTGLFVISTSTFGLVCSDEYFKQWGEFPKMGGELLFQIVF